MKRTFSILLLFLTAFGSLLAQVTFKVQAPEMAEVGQRIRISYVVNTTDVEDFQTGDFSGFNVLYGPSTSKSSSFSMTNGRTSHSSTLTFTYTVVPTKEGTCKVPVATIVVDGKQIKSNSATIEVLPSSNAQQPQQNGRQGGGGAGQQQQNAGSTGQIAKGDLYMTVTANRQKIYEQEAVMLTYKLYTLVNIQQISGDMPQLDGCHVQEMDRAAQMSLKYERVNGRNYGTAVWKQYVLFPQKTGKLKVPSITFDTQVEVQNHSMDPFDIFFGGGSLSQMVHKQITAPALEIEVMPLPTPKPDNFSGAVGKFSISASLTPEQVKANDAATLRLAVSGQGNMKLMKAPKVDFPKDFEVYDPKESNQSTNTATGAKGTITYDYVIVPRHGGKFSIPPVSFCYFDPESSKYITLQTESFSLDVAKGAGRVVSDTHEQEDLNVLSQDIRFIKLSPLSTEQPDDFFGTSAYWLAYVLLLAVFAVVVLIIRRQRKRNPNSWSTKGKRAGKTASRRLKTASKLMRGKDDAAFYDEVMRALLGYAGDKLSLPTNELNKDNVVEKLTARGVAQDIQQAFLSVLSECEFARYAPVDDPGMAKEKIYQQASDVITRMDAQLKSNK